MHVYTLIQLWLLMIYWWGIACDIVWYTPVRVQQQIHSFPQTWIESPFFKTADSSKSFLRPLAWLGSHGLEPLLAKIFSQPMCDLGMDNSYRIEVVQNISEVGYLSLVEPYWGDTSTLDQDLVYTTQVLATYYFSQAMQWILAIVYFGHIVLTKWSCSNACHCFR